MDEQVDSWEFYKGENGDWYWDRKAANHKIVGASSEGYRHYTDCVDNARRNGFTEDQPHHTR